MDICLNITNIPAPPKPVKNLATAGRIGRLPVQSQGNNKSSGRNGFSFEFGGSGQKIKAVVARRRVVPKPQNSENSKKPSNEVESPVGPTPQRNYVLKPQDSNSKINNRAVVSNGNTLKTYNSISSVNRRSIAVRKKVATPLSNTQNAVNADGSFSVRLSEPICDDIPKKSSTNLNEDIVLNVTRTPNPFGSAVKPKEKKTREERFREKRNNRGQRNEKEIKALTAEELHKGIKQFSKGPAHKRPLNKKSTDSSVKSVNLFAKTEETKIIGQRLVKPLTEKIFTGDSISSLELHPHCVKNLADILNITELTTIQQKTIPRALEGRDILVRSQTGSGKTLAYALPVVQKLQEIRPKLDRTCGISAVIIVPTRELAIQTYELLLKLLKPFTWIVPGVLTGGERRKAEKARLRKGINILVGTPGRLVDHLLHTESFKLDQANFLILDEADRLLEMGYERDVKQIVEAIDEQRLKAKVEGKTETNLQRLLLSATLTPAVQKLAGLTLKNPLFIDNNDEDPSEVISATENYDNAVQEALDEGKLIIPENLTLNYIVVPPKLRLVTLSAVLAKEFTKNKLKAVVFMSTMEMVDFHHDLMNEQLTQKILDDEDEPNESLDGDETPLLMGLRFFKLHGSMTQQERSGVFKAFRDAKCGVLITTDVCGRGIDVPEVDLVVQYSPPQKISDFVHRVGRTARAGKSGRSVLFLSLSETPFIRKLEDKRIRISQTNLDDYLNALVAADPTANNIQEAASNLQHRFEELIVEDKEVHDKACKAYVSWVRFYSTFSKELKPIFNIKVAHMGHFAKSFGLREQPTTFTKRHAAPKPQQPTNRLTYTERDPEKIKLDKKETKKRRLATTVTPNRFMKFIPKSLSLTTSEFDSGMPAKKKKKT